MSGKAAGLLYGVRLQVPEPSTWAIAMLGVAGAGVLSRRRRNGVAVAVAA